MCARQPADCGFVEPRARPRGGPDGLEVGRLHPHAGRADLADRQPLLRLEVRVRARAAHERPQGLPRARQGARRLELDQRDDLPARQSARHRALGARPRHGVVELRALPAVLQEDGDVPGRRRRVSRRRRAAAARARPGHEPALHGVLRGDPAGRVHAHLRRQRLPPGGLRALRPQHPARPAAERGAGLPAPRARAPEPRAADARAGHARAVRGHARGRRRVPRRQGPAQAGARGRGHPLRRFDQHAAGARALGRRRRQGARGARHRRGARPARCRREPAGPPRGLRPVLVQAAGLGRARDALSQPPGRVPEVAAPPRAGRARRTTSRAAASRAPTTT